MASVCQSFSQKCSSRLERLFIMFFIALQHIDLSACREVALKLKCVSSACEFWNKNLVLDFSVNVYIPRLLSGMRLHKTPCDVTKRCLMFRNLDKRCACRSLSTWCLHVIIFHLTVQIHDGIWLAFDHRRNTIRLRPWCRLAFDVSFLRQTNNAVHYLWKIPTVQLKL